eukprot:scaffold3339_cov174-Amphora_coffeaeformis.AAC.13
MSEELETWTKRASALLDRCTHVHIIDLNHHRLIGMHTINRKRTMSQVNNTATAIAGAVFVETYTLCHGERRRWKECWKAAGYQEDDFLPD